MASITINQVYNHPELVKVKVVSKKPNSRTIYIVECVDRGKGFDEKTQSYKGHKNPVGWMRGENREFGKQFEVHKKTLTNE